MKKSTSIIFFSSLICMTVGTIVMVIVGAVGGKKIVSDLFHEVKNMGIYADDFEMILPDEFEDLSFIHFSGTEEIGVSENGIQSLYVSVKGGEIQVERGNFNDIIMVTQDGINMKYSIEGGTLVIAGGEGNLFNAGEVEIYLPSDMEFEDMTFAIGGGQLDADGIHAKTVTLEVGAGEANVEDIHAESLDANVGAGEIEIENTHISEKMVVNVGMGSAIIGGWIDSDMDLRCGMGDLEVDTMGNSYADYNYNLKCAAGNVDLGHDSYSGVSVSKHIENGSDKTIDIDCGMGNVSVEF